MANRGPPAAVSDSVNAASSMSGPDIAVVAAQVGAKTRRPNRRAVARPTPEIVGETVGSLEQDGGAVWLSVVVRALQDRTGCSRAGAYSAVKDAIAAGTITGP